jgi:hypothetical protein
MDCKHRYRSNLLISSLERALPFYSSDSNYAPWMQQKARAQMPKRKLARQI